MPAPTHGFTPESLPQAVGRLFELNNFSVEYSVKRHGAEIDIVARSLTDQFSPTIYIEVTVEYVSNTKYGKDLTKFSLIKEIEPSATCICVSAVGFTPDVAERASKTRITTLTYEGLFRGFEKFGPYVGMVRDSVDNLEFEQTYEEPLLQDDHGEVVATAWLGDWRFTEDPARKWLIILGEYGTGKTSLTRVLQYRWIQDYVSSPDAPIPVRIELRNFTRQFDARTLLHHFLDTNRLGHVPVEFMFQLIRSGRVVLILDGYDEMAQFLNPRERRACLGALAELAREGARGLLTSRPNYFSEAEELRVFDSLYSTLEQNRYYISRADRAYLDTEKAIDNLVERYVLERYERHLRDLTEDQTEALVRRKLRDDPSGQEIILHLLRRVFRVDASGGRISLSGKPVIIAYLLELIDDLRSTDDPAAHAGNLTEWQIYRMIVDRLMMRDQQRSPLDPERRRQALQRLAVALSGKGAGVATEETFREVINKEFERDLKLMSPEERRHRRDELFEDIRSSATLTRAEGGAGGGWLFSHNSLREFLVVERFVRSILARDPSRFKIPTTDAMRAFVASMPVDLKAEARQGLKEIWRGRYAFRDVGGYVGLFWPMLTAQQDAREAIQDAFASAGSKRLDMEGVRLQQIKFGPAIGPDLELNCTSTEIAECEFESVNLAGSVFSNAILDTVIFRHLELAGTEFRGAWMVDCDFDFVNFVDADFRGLSADSRIFVVGHDGFKNVYSGKSLIGLLSSRGAQTDRVPDYYYYQHHPLFTIVRKIGERLTSQRNSQLLGLTQRGESEKDPPFARAFVDFLKSRGLININKNDLVSATPDGRHVLTLLVSHEEVDSVLIPFFSERMEFRRQ